MSKHTYILVKPETNASGLAIIRQKLTELADENDSLYFYEEEFQMSHLEVRSIYGPLSVEIADATTDHLAHRPLKIFKVSGDDKVVDLIAAIKGSDIDSTKCAKGTLRRMLADLHGVSAKQRHYVEDLGDNVFYHRNFVHIPKNEDEVLRCDGVFAKHFK